MLQQYLKFLLLLPGLTEIVAITGGEEHFSRAFIGFVKVAIILRYMYRYNISQLHQGPVSKIERRSFI